MRSTVEEQVRRSADQLGARSHGSVAVGAVHGEQSAMHGADPRPLLQIGSITKTFTELALAQLAVKGDVQLGGGVGIITGGHPADLIVVDGDPRADLELLRAPRHVIARGQLLDIQWARQTIQHLTASVTD